MSKRTEPTAAEILARAEVLLASPLPHDWACCEYSLGLYCPRCAVARAKGDLTREMSYDSGDYALMLVSSAIALLDPAPSRALDRESALAIVQEAKTCKVR